MNYLLELKEKHRKMEKLECIELKLQKNPKNDKIPVAEAKTLDRNRKKSARINENMKNSYQSTSCPFLSSQTLKAFSVNTKGNYNDIFTEDIPCNISKTLFKISQLKEEVSIYRGPSASN